MIKHNFLLIIIFFRIIYVIYSMPGDRKIVHLKDGSISGVEDRTGDMKITFWAFLGIPYAAPPVGNLRFMPPQKVKPWHGVRDASVPGKSCMQTHLVAMPISEDCLFINVYTTALSRDNFLNQTFPVMVYIHGGGFRIGTGNIGIHGADRFLDSGIVFVTFNYRLGAFGFLCTLDDAAPGNYGLKDQIAALKWIKKNIAVFGGDPDSVTLYGQSSGAASIHYLYQTEHSEGLFHAAITSSGSSLSSWAYAQLPRQNAFNAGAMNLIFTENSTLLVERLRKIRPIRLLGVSGAISSSHKSRWKGLAWAPCIEDDKTNGVVLKNSYELLKRGTFNRVPLMTGFNSLEARDVNILSWLVKLFSNEYNFKPELLVPSGINPIFRKEVGKKIKQFYFQKLTVKNNTKFIKYASDALFLRSIHKHVEFMSPYIPVYFYKFSFIGGASHNDFYPQGASHAEELQFLFNENFQRQRSKEAFLIQDRMIRLWTNFAKYYDPTPYPEDVLANITWPKTNEQEYKLTYLNIDGRLQLQTNPEKAAMKFWDEIYKLYGKPPLDTY